MIPWDKIHGATTHFPIALLLFSTACDFVSVTFRKLTFALELRLVSFYGLAGAALASVGAVVSGIALTKGDLWGRGYFAWHHRFVWPAFGLLIALAVWRLVVRDAMSRSGLCLYLILMLVASGFVAAAGLIRVRISGRVNRWLAMDIPRGVIVFVRGYPWADGNGVANEWNDRSRRFE